MSKETYKKTLAKALKPDVELLALIGSALVHADESLSGDGRQVDIDEFRRLMNDRRVKEWIRAMGPMLPVKRTIT